MEWIERLNEAVDYLEGRLAGEIRYEEAARAACCSTYHFQRMFAYLAGVPLSEYIRRRRMTLAAADLQTEKIIDVGLKYGYASPTAFNRAFQGVHGVPPSRAREPGAALKSYPRIRFQITIQGAEEMNYRIEKKAAFRVVGVERKLEREIERNFEAVPQMWQTVAADGTLGRLAGMMDAEPKAILGVSACGEEEEWRYWIAVASTRPAGEGLKEFIVPEATWAVFPGKGTNQSVQELERRIITDWLPSSGYEYGNAPDVEAYYSPDPANAVYEVWIPVVKAKEPEQ